ncbi:MmgE/PrpD family protein [Achromobacter aloeverae]|uniref:MmgE/PrpD family protein n=1 Tax=Achromobacter aloeverae TaxID=1750518 RepID=A0A4Q1HHS0_9BURK|nr:MmgE/PrpD family protein [Achromobacter aloeverae]RXN86127.1 MmgE/PrpD family protein [Achromobacter aloeverae]
MSGPGRPKRESSLGEEVAQRQAGHSTSATAILAGYAVRPPLALTAAQAECCARSLADTVAVCLAGRAEPATTAAHRYLEEAGLLTLDGATASSTLWGAPYRAAPEIAAWANGLAGHVLDYDDVTVPMRGHPSVVLWPAILALGEARDLTGRQACSAFAIGMQAICQLSRAFASRQYEHGWHTTASIGILGATIACAHLLGLDEARTRHALGLALAQAAGARANVGSQAKAFQAGQAGAAGLRAACLAAAGLEAGTHALEHPQGYLKLYAGTPDAALEPWSDDALELERSGLDVKQYPMCYATHRALDAVLALREAHGVVADDVVAIHVETSHAALLPLIHPRPATGLQGKFSLPYAMAAAILDGHVRLSSFTDEAVQRPAVQRLQALVTSEETAGPINPRWARVTLDLRDGRRLTRQVRTLNGSHEQPLSEQALCAKLDDCLAWGGFGAGGEALLERCRDLPAQGCRDFMRALDAGLRR